MSGTIQARAIRHTGDSQISVQPVACPLAGRVGSVDALYCTTHDPHELEHMCPYFVALVEERTPTRRYGPGEIDALMTVYAIREHRVRVICLEAKPAAMPGA